MTYEIKTENRDGWHATSTVEIGQTPEGKRVLELTTYKSRNYIAAHVSTFIYLPDGSKTTVIFQDFTKNKIALTPCNRVSEKAVLQVHNLALLDMDSIIEEAKAFYVELEASAA